MKTRATKTRAGRPKRSAVGEAFHARFGSPEPAAPNGIFFKNDFDRSVWKDVQSEIGSGWYLDRFLYLFGDDLEHLRECLDSWAFLVPEGRDRLILGRNAYGAILVLENASAIGEQQVHVLDPFRVAYWTDPNIAFVNLIGAWLPDGLIPGFLDRDLYRAWIEVRGAPLEDHVILAPLTPAGLGGEMVPENFQEEDIVTYYGTTAPVYEKAWKKMGRAPARRANAASSTRAAARPAVGAWKLARLRGTTEPPAAPAASWSLHKDLVHELAVLPRGDELVSSSEDGKLLLSSLSSKKRLKQLTGHQGPVNTLCLTPDGKRLVTGGDDRQVCIRDVVSWKVTTRLKGHTDYVRCVAASDRLVVSGSDDHSVRIWDSKTGRCLHQGEHAASADTVAISADGRLAASASRDNALWVWDPGSGEKRVIYDSGGEVFDVSNGLYLATKNRTGKGHLEAPCRLIFLRDGTLLSVGAEVIVWDPETGEEKRRFAAGGVFRSGATIDRQEKRLLILERGSLQLWDLHTGARLAAAQAGRWLKFATFTPDGEQIVTGDDGGLTRWEVATVLGAVAPDHDERVEELTVRGGHAVSCSSEGSLQLWGIEDGRSLGRLAPPQSGDRPYAFSRDAARLLVGDELEGVAVWDVGAARRTGQLSCEGTPHGLAFIEDDRVLVGHLGDGLVEHRLGGAARPLQGYTSQVSEILVRPDRRIAVTSGFFQPGAEKRGGKERGSRSSECMLQGWDLKKRTLLWSLVHKHNSSFFLFTSEGHLVMQSPNRKATIAVLETTRGEILRQIKLPEYSEWLTAARLLEGDILLCADGGTVHRFDCGKGKQLDTCSLDVADRVESLAFSPDGTLAAAASGSSLTLCKAADGRLLCSASTPAELKSCAFSDDGRRVIAGDQAGRIYLFAVEPA